MSLTSYLYILPPKHYTQISHLSHEIYNDDGGTIITILRFEKKYNRGSWHSLIHRNLEILLRSLLLLKFLPYTEDCLRRPQFWYWGGAPNLVSSSALVLPSW